MSSLTDSERDILIDLSNSAKEKAYARYSNFRVGCALLTKCGKTITGCNVENVSYGLTICAERTAYTKAVSEGYLQFKAVAVSTDVDGTFTWPCGACRQFMSEFGDVEVISVNKDKKHEMSTLGKLLPNSFSEEALTSGQKYNK